MPIELRQRIRDLIGVGLDELPGASVGGEIPLPDPVVNRLVAQALARSSAPVTAVRIQSEDGDRLVANVTIRGPRLIPELKVLIEIERQPSADDPVLLLRWSLPGMGPLAMIAAPFVSNLKGLPRGIRIDGERVHVDVAELVRAQGAGDLLPLITRLELGTQAGRVIVRFGLRT